MRKHFYLITEHDNDERHGGVSITDTRATRPTKDSEAPIRIYDEDAGDFRIVGKKVGLGYHDFADEQEYEDTVSDVLKGKIREVNQEWAEKAEIADHIYGDSDD